MIAESPKAKTTLRYWKASLAWKNIGDWSKGWTAGSFIKEVREICNDNGSLGWRADKLLDDMIHERERSPLPESGIVIDLHSKVAHVFMTQDLGQAIQV